jgi:hypothetical protein
MDNKRSNLREENLRNKFITVCDKSPPVSMIRKHNGIISVESKNLITSWSSVFTRAPITPREVSLKYS